MEKVYADVMLAKLARWLRLAGVPVLDAPYVDDTRLLGAVGRRKGLLLTSDEELFARARKRGVEALLVRQEGDREAGRAGRRMAGRAHKELS
jgi:hypothetical protein